MASMTATRPRSRRARLPSVDTSVASAASGDPGVTGESSLSDRTSST